MDKPYSRFPFPAYPNSWYTVAWSRELPVGKAIPLRYFGRDLVAFRGHDRRVCVLDAHCPHLGAHLGINGRVVGDTIRCPFHAWQFDGNGRCVHIPYNPAIPPRARVGAWPVTEKNGAIMVYYHESGASPTFDIPSLPGIEDPAWTHPMYYSVDVRTRVQEMNENVFDVAHFLYIHHFERIPETVVQIDGPYAHIRLTGPTVYHGLRMLGDVTSSMYGAGFTLIHVHRPLEVKVFVSKTPIDEDIVQHRYAVVTRRRLSGLDQILHRVACAQVRKDVLTDSAIWEGKRYLRQPCLVKNDGPIMRFRHWHQQFYSSAPEGEPASPPASASAG